MPTLKYLANRKLYFAFLGCAWTTLQQSAIALVVLGLTIKIQYVSRKCIHPLTDLKGIFNPILCHTFIVLLGGSHFICQVTQNEEGLLCSNADQLTRV